MPHIFMLHRVLPEYDPDNYYFKRETAISWNRFIAILDQIETDGMQSLTVSEMGESSNNPSVFITFDDGYADNEPALNEILKRGMRATIFPVKQFIKEDFSPIDDMAYHLMAHKSISAELYSSFMSGRFKKLLRRLSVNRYRYLRKRWFGLNEDASPKGLFFNDKQLADFASRGLELGIHGVSHRVFTSLSDSELLEELKDSKEWLQSLGAGNTLSICFPHGSHDRRTVGICSDFGSHLFGVDSPNLYKPVLRRIHIKEEANELGY